MTDEMIEKVDIMLDVAEKAVLALEIAESTYYQPIDVALVYENLGNAYHEQDQEPLALTFYEKALQILIEKSVDNIRINAIETKIYQSYVKLLESNNQEIKKKFQINMKPFIFTATVVNFNLFRGNATLANITKLIPAYTKSATVLECSNPL